jgi:uncharacterized protein (TIGR03118 family)
MKFWRFIAALWAGLFLTIVFHEVAGAMMMPTQGSMNQYSQTNLVSDGSFSSVTTDPNLVNAWGLANLAGSPFWINDNGTGVSTLYDGMGVPQPAAPAPLIVTIPPPNAASMGTVSTPTGMVANATPGFVLSSTGPALFIFDTEDGTVSAWNLGGSSSPPTTATLMVDNSAAGAVYKGLAMGTNTTGTFLFATNFNSGKVDVFDNTFAPATLSGSFADSTIPAGYAPFGIANINGSLFVSYALQDSKKHDDVAGHGHGFVDIFDTNGKLIRRFASRGSLDSPWGMTQATFNFGTFSGAILIGNFGNGTINAFDPVSGRSLGGMHKSGGSMLDIDGLWALSFGNGALNALPDTLYFTSGPDKGSHGLFGAITTAN